MTPDEFRKFGHQLIDWIADYRAGVAELPLVPGVKHLPKRRRPCRFFLASRMRREDQRGSQSISDPLPRS